MKGIDLSHHNGTVNFDAAKAAGLQFCVIELGYGQDEVSQDDSMFARNVSECKRLGIPWGAYLYSYAQSASAAHGEANHARRLLSGKHPTYMFIDMEDADGYKARNGGIQDAQVYTDIIKTFCTDMAAAGYKAGWYANKDWHDTHLHPEQLSAYPFWYARPACGTVESYGQIIVQDQIGETGGTFPGVSGSCDTDVCNDGVFTTSGTPQPAAPTTPSAPAFPLLSGSYFGPKNGPAASVSGYYSHRDDLRTWQSRMSARGWEIDADGLYGDQTANVVRQFQREKGLTVDGLIGPQTWAAAWTAPVTA